MSVNAEINRISNAKTDIINKIEEKGGTVMVTAKLDDLAAAMDTIPSGKASNITIKTVKPENENDEKIILYIKSHDDVVDHEQNYNETNIIINTKNLTSSIFNFTPCYFGKFFIYLFYKNIKEHYQFYSNGYIIDFQNENQQEEINPTVWSIKFICNPNTNIFIFSANVPNPDPGRSHQDPVNISVNSNNNSEIIVKIPPFENINYEITIREEGKEDININRIISNNDVIDVRNL